MEISEESVVQNDTNKHYMELYKISRKEHYRDKYNFVTTEIDMVDSNGIKSVASIVSGNGELSGDTELMSVQIDDYVAVNDIDGSSSIVAIFSQYGHLKYFKK